MTQHILCKSAEVAPNGKFHPLYSGLLICLPHSASIFLESSGRVEEIMLWVLPRFLEQAWAALKKTKVVPGDVPLFKEIIFAISIG